MSRLPLLAMLLFVAANPLPLSGQTAPPAAKPIPHVLLQIEQRTPQQMDTADRQLLADRRAELERAVTASGYDLQQGSWAYQQAVCPLFPGTLLLRYESEDSPGHASRFVAVVDRASGQVRVAPTLRSGNTTFHSSYKNDTSYSIFNQILAREGLSLRSPSLQAGEQWVKLALCYAEVSGNHPTTLLTDTLYGEAFERNVNVPVKRVGAGGAVVLEFCDVNDPAATMQWDLSFDSHGSLVAVERKRRPLNSPLRRLRTISDFSGAADSK